MLEGSASGLVTIVKDLIKLRVMEWFYVESQTNLSIKMSRKKRKKFFW